VRTALLQPSQLKSGTLAYDLHGNVIGRLGSDGKVRNQNGDVIGQVGPDGLVRAADGTVIGAAAVPAVGDPVYDGAGHLIGRIGADGKVRDAQGRVIGMVNPDGTVRNLKGGILGKVGSNTNVPTGKNNGVAVYDAQGHFLGIAGADGKVRDANGHVIGEMAADGSVRDANGKVIGHANLIKGSLNKENPVIPGAPVYDDQGKLIGTVGSDGRVRDSQGKVIATVDRNGVAYGPNHQILGKIGATAPGTPIYDKQGHLIGTVDSTGIVRDSRGMALATVGADGVARDAQGNPIGSTVAPTFNASGSFPNNVLGAGLGVSNLPDQNAVSLIPSASDNSNPALQAILERQAQQISAQKAEQLQQQIQASMSTQATQLFAAWASPTQQYVTGASSLSNQFIGGGTAGFAAGSEVSKSPPVVKAGTIMYAVLLTAVNSDEPGPVLAKIVEGKFQGGRLLGTLTNQGKKVLLAFNTLTLPNVPQSIAINTVAIDENTARTALSSYTNNHYWLRYGTLFAAAFLQGYGQSFLAAGANYSGAVIINPSSTVLNLNPRQRIFVGLGQVGVQYASVLGSVFSMPPTVHVYSGTPMGILFLSDLFSVSASNGNELG